MATNSRIEKIVIVGGGTAGWMTAAAFSKVLNKDNVNIVLVESDQIGTVSVGEATIPQISLFNKILGIDENEFLSKTNGTFKLGIEFIDWRKKNHRYMHPFGNFGTDMEAIQFHHYWLKMFNQGQAPDIENYSLAAVGAKQNRFMRPVNMGNSPISELAYAFHFDAVFYAKFLREFAEQRGVKRVEGKVVSSSLRANDGFIESVTLEDHKIIPGDLFIDCSGFRALLIEKALDVGYQDWSHWLPCDRAIAIPCEKQGELKPYTQSTAHQSGWRWRIPLQHRTGNGVVYSSAHCDDESALQNLLDNLDGKPLNEPNRLGWVTGMRKKAWHKNCVAIGLSSGFIEPLESTSIHLIQSSIAKLLGLFPDKSFKQVDIDKFNQQNEFELERIRDFIILHYHVTERDDSEFWNHCRTMEIPDLLREKIELYKSHGRIYREHYELFNETSWLAVMHGQGIQTDGYHPIVDNLSEQEIKRRLQHIQSVIVQSSQQMPSHLSYINQHCLAN